MQSLCRGAVSPESTCSSALMVDMSFPTQWELQWRSVRNDCSSPCSKAPVLKNKGAFGQEWQWWSTWNSPSQHMHSLLLAAAKGRAGWATQFMTWRHFSTWKRAGRNRRPICSITELMKGIASLPLLSVLVGEGGVDVSCGCLFAESSWASACNQNSEKVHYKKDLWRTK